MKIILFVIFAVALIAGIVAWGLSDAKCPVCKGKGKEPCDECGSGWY